MSNQLQSARRQTTCWIDHPDTDSGMRIDKWLWAARFFKTRALAQAAIAAGKVKIDGERVKAAKEITPGEVLSIRIGSYEWEVTVRALSKSRGSASIASTLYEEQPASRERRLALIAARKAAGEQGGGRKGRPTKRQRRQIIRFTSVFE